MTSASVDACSNVAIGVYRYLHEHLGQLIAYARMNGGKPPWIK